MRDPVLFAVPLLLLLLTIEWTAARTLEKSDAEQDPDPTRPARGAYLSPDARASISMGLVSVVTMGAWKFLGCSGTRRCTPTWRPGICRHGSGTRG